MKNWPGNRFKFYTNICLFIFLSGGFGINYCYTCILYYFRYFKKNPFSINHLEMNNVRTSCFFEIFQATSIGILFCCRRLFLRVNLEQFVTCISISWSLQIKPLILSPGIGKQQLANRIKGFLTSSIKKYFCCHQIYFPKILYLTSLLNVQSVDTQANYIFLETFSGDVFVDLFPEKICLPIIFLF